MNCLQARTNLRAISQRVPAGLLKRVNTLETMWLLVIKRLEETTERFYDPEDCANHFISMIHFMDLGLRSG